MQYLFCCIETCLDYSDDIKTLRIHLESLLVNIIPWCDTKPLWFVKVPGAERCSTKINSYFLETGKVKLVRGTDGPKQCGHGPSTHTRLSRKASDLSEKVLGTSGEYHKHLG